MKTSIHIKLAKHLDPCLIHSCGPSSQRVASHRSRWFLTVSRSGSRTPLHCAASCNSVHLCKQLVESGAAIFASTISDIETAADKCEEMEEGYIQCSQFLYGMYGGSVCPSHFPWLIGSVCLSYCWARVWLSEWIMRKCSLPLCSPSKHWKSCLYLGGMNPHHLEGLGRCRPTCTWRDSALTKENRNHIGILFSC